MTKRTCILADYEITADDLRFIANLLYRPGDERIIKLTDDFRIDQRLGKLRSKIRRIADDFESKFPTERMLLMSHAPETCQDIDNHCFWHHVDEVIPLTGAYQVCGECMHVFLTAADLVRDTNETIRRINRAYPNDPPIPLEIQAQNIYHCPHCAHDF